MSLKITNTMQLAVALTAIGVTTTAALWSARRERPANKVPRILLESQLSKQLRLAVRLAKAAGATMVEYLDAKGTTREASMDLGIETKSGDADLCTMVDVENERLVTEGIRSEFPHHDIIGEEAVGTGVIPPLRTDVPTWIIDPIDGTTNFSAGIHSLTCVSIAFCENGRPVLGVIYAPGTDELYLAIQGYGAYRNGTRIKKTPARSTKTLKSAVVCCEFGYSRDKVQVDKILGGVSKIMQAGCRAIRQFGSGCLDLCMVASGRLDIVYAGLADEGWKPWDYAAGLIICQEAGCVMESLDQKAGEDFDLYSKSLICGGSQELVDETRQLLLSNTTTTN